MLFIYSTRERSNRLASEISVRLASGILSCTVYVNGIKYNVDPIMTMQYDNEVSI